jgi:two-component system KDP operon response regulator KdpE
MTPRVDPVILLIDNDAVARQSLWDPLSSLNYRLLEASTAAKGLALVRSFRPNLVMTDILLPDMDGIDLVRRLRVEKETIVVVLSNLASSKHVVAALDAGADDFIAKPFSMGELLARVRVALRHSLRRQESRSHTFQEGELEVDFKQRVVRVSGNDVHLTPLEYRILTLLINNAGRVLTYDRLLRAWNSQQPRQLQHVRVLMWQLRRKLEPDPTKPRLLVTASGVGYQIQLRGQ